MIEKIQKPLLTIEEQIEHLKSKGVLFNIINEDDAKKYLRNNINYFKLTSYRKNYPVHPDGINKGKYINLEFAYLIDLAIIDMNLRYRIIQMALDIEHHTKLELINKVVDSRDDGYTIVKDYKCSLDAKQNDNLENEILRNLSSVYCGEMICKYGDNMPVWVFIEVIPFGRLVSFYKFCYKRYSDDSMEENYYRLLMCKELRNAAAHSNCVINNLSSRTSKYNTNKDVTKALTKIPNISSTLRRQRMSNARIQQIVTLLYTYKKVVLSDGLKNRNTQQMEDLVDRVNKNIDYYKTNRLISTSLYFLITIINEWFINEKILKNERFIKQVDKVSSQ